MPRPGSGSTKLTISGTRGDDAISVGPGGVSINGTFKVLDQAKIDAGLIIKGGDGNDTITGGPGIDTLDGGRGNDLLRDTIDTTFVGGAGNDTVDLSDSSAGVAIDLQGTGTVFQDSTVYDPGNGYLEAILGNAVNGTLQGIENLIGTNGNDWIMGNAAANVLHGGAGDDIITAKSVSDIAADSLFGDDGNDNLFAGNGNDQLTGGAGRDTFSFEPGTNHGDWVVTDYTPGEDRVVLFPYSGTVSWETNLAENYVRATVGDDTITLLGVTDYTTVDLIITTTWPPL